MLVRLEHGSMVIGVQRRTQTKGSPCLFPFPDLSIPPCPSHQVETAGSPNRPPDPSLKSIYRYKQKDKVMHSCK